MARYEYQVIQTRPDFYSSTEKQLQKWARQGWKVAAHLNAAKYSYDGDNIWLLERKIPWWKWAGWW